MAYKLSERLNQNHQPEEDPVNLNTLASVFFIAAIFSFITAWVFTWESRQVYNQTIRPTTFSTPSPESADEGKELATVGPITVLKYKEVYSITLISTVPQNTWVFLEGEVLDSEKDYLFSFGKELWHEIGYDDEGAWAEADNNYTMKVTFPQPGAYYLNLKTQGNYSPDAIRVKISKQYGSSIPHFIFGLLCLLIGIVINEVRNKTIKRIFEGLNDD